MAQLLHLTGQALRDTSGNPYTAAKAYFYETGTTTPKNTYSDAGLTSANANPVVADGTTGLFPDIYLLAGRYKVVLQQSDSTSIDTWDPLDGTLQLIAAASAPSPTYAFLRYHNTTDGHVYRRNAANSAWIDEGAVDSLGNAATVTQQLAGTATDAFSTPDSVAALWQRGTDIASGAGATVSLPATGGKHYNITGTSGLTGISSASGGRTVSFRFADACLLTHNGTSFILPGAANFTTAAGDIWEFTNEAAQDATGSNWKCSDVTLASGSPINITAQLGSQAEAETGTSTTKTLPIGNMKYLSLMPKAWASFNGSTAGTNAPTEGSGVTSITRSAAGDYTVNLSITMSTATYGVFGFCNSVTAGTGGFVSRDPTDSKTTTTFRIRARRSDTGAAIDSTEISIFVFGDI